MTRGIGASPIAPGPTACRIAVNFTADFDAMLLRRAAQRAADAARQGRIRRTCRHLAADRAVRLRTASRRRSSRRAASANSTRRRCARPSRAATRSPITCGSIGCRRSRRSKRTIWRKTVAALERLAGPPPGRHAQQPHAELLREHGLSSTAPRARPTSGRITCSTADGDNGLAQPAVPLRHRRRHVLQLRLARQRQRRRSASPTPSGCSTSGGRRSGSNTAQGGYLNVCMHPFLSGRALRIAMLDRLIARMKTLPGVWFPTCEQVARHCLDAPSAARGRALNGRSATMPWKQGYTISDERSLADAELRWPDGNRCCVTRHRRSERRLGSGGHPRRGPRDARGACSARIRGSLRCATCFAGTRIRATFAVPGGHRAYPSPIRCARSPPRATRSPRTASGTRMSAGSSARRSRRGIDAHDRDPRRCHRAAGRPAGSRCRGRATITRAAPSAPTRSIC